MALIDELHERRKILSDSRDEMRASLRQTEAEIDDLTVAIWALEGTTEEEGRALQTEATAIAALTPTPDFEAEKATAREQLEREPEIPAGFTKWVAGDPFPSEGFVEVLTVEGHCNQHPAADTILTDYIIAYRIIEAAPADEQDDASEFQAELASQPDVDEPPGGPPIPASEWIEPQAGLAPDLDTGDDEQDDASEFAESGADLIAGFGQPIGQLAVVDGQLVATLQDGTTHNVSEFAEPAHDQAETVAATSPGEVEESRDQSEDGLGSSLIAMGYGDDDAPAEHISILTGDPAIEPESGLHGEPTDLQGDTVQEMQQAFDDVFRAQEEAAALNADMQDEREEGYAPVTNPEAHIQAVEAERYALATNPEADALARARDWYDPKAVAERNKFNPFSIFRREDA